MLTRRTQRSAHAGATDSWIKQLQDVRNHGSERTILPPMPNTFRLRTGGSLDAPPLGDHVRDQVLRGHHGTRRQQEAVPVRRHQPPVFLDESMSFIRGQQGGDHSNVSTYVRVPGAVNTINRLRLALKENGKVLVIVNCTVDGAMVVRAPGGKERSL